MTHPLGFRKSSSVPITEREGERDILKSETPHRQCKRSEWSDAGEHTPVEAPYGIPANSYRPMCPAGRILTSQEPRDSTPYSPHANGRSLRCDFPAWRGCARARKRIHQNATYREATRSSLVHFGAVSSNGGTHLSRHCICVVAIDVYVQALREEDPKPEGMKGNTWRPKTAVADSGEDRIINRAIGIQPDEFVEIDLAALWNDMGALRCATDKWVHSEQSALLGWAISESLTKEKR